MKRQRDGAGVAAIRRTLLSKPPVLLAATALLIVATLATFLSESRFRTAPGVVVENLDFHAGRQGWTHRGRNIRLSAGTPRELVIHAQPVAAYLARLFDRPRGTELLRVSAEVRGRALGGSERWQGGTLALLSYDARGRLNRYWPNRVARVKGDLPWTRFERVLPLQPQTTRLLLIAYAAGFGGDLGIRHLEVRAARERPGFALARWGLAGLWVVLWGRVLYTLLRHRPRGPTLEPGRLGMQAATVLIANGLILAGLAPQPRLNDTLKRALLGAQDAYFAGRDLWADWQAASDSSERPVAGAAASTDRRRIPNGGSRAAAGSTGSPTGNDSHGRLARRHVADAAHSGSAAPETGGEGEANRAAARSRQRPSPRHYWMPRWEDLDKTEHIGSFVFLALLAGLAYSRNRLLLRVAILLALSAAIQTLQLYQTTREPDFADLRADALGILAGTLVAGVLVAAARRALRKTRQGALPPRAAGRNGPDRYRERAPTS